MRAAISTVILLLVSFSAGCSQESRYEPSSGDIIFQTSKSNRSKAIQLATKSKYSHMGIVFVRDGEPFVFEGVEPVKATPLKEWIARGEGRHFVVKRLANASTVLTSEALERMKIVGDGFKGMPYDLCFEWSDDRIYCSELVWKIYQRSLGIEIGAPETLGDFELSSPSVQKELKECWGDNLPLEEKVISPGAMFDSNLLVEVFSNGVS